ncbi:aldose epimerase family protein [Aquibacillus kalidii]|uniref:aldose epimerase family protein n=1 Tax=Aquibacillus kalidii TaxID=2762597 RepID=UPI0016473468|nr:aldose epimerase family protein [Aquibacillus kalidii]
MQIKTEIARIKDQDCKLYTLINDNGMEVSCLNYGGIITKILAPDRNNNFENVVLGFKDYEDYTSNPAFFGALIGRIAGRIQESSFEIDGKSYTVPENDGPNHLHGGTPGFHKAIWEAEPFEGSDEVGVILTHTSPDGENGYPGNLKMNVTYTLNNNNEFSITYEGTSDQKTALTVTNHSYFNLSGNLKSDILDHNVTLNANKFVELDSALIPTGNILPVEGTVFDFQSGRKIKDGVNSDYVQNLNASNGYDHYFLFDNQQENNVVVVDEHSGRTLKVKTDQPGMVMYTSNNLPEQLQLQEGPSKRYLGVCLETQASPASLHHQGFPSVLLDKDEKYYTKTTFAFGVK